MSLGHHHSSSESSLPAPAFVQEPPSKSLLYVKTSMNSRSYSAGTPTKQRKKYRPEYLIYKALFFMVGLEIGDEPGTRPEHAKHKFIDTQEERDLLNNLVQTHQTESMEACEKIKGDEKTYAKERLLPRKPGSLIDIYCNVIEQYPASFYHHTPPYGHGPSYGDYSPYNYYSPYGDYSSYSHDPAYGHNLPYRTTPLNELLNTLSPFATLNPSYDRKIPYVSIIGDLHKAIKFNNFLSGKKERVSLDDSYETKMLFMKHVSESIRKGKQTGVSLYEVHESLQAAIYYLVMERFYLNYHSIFGSLRNMLSSLHLIMRTFFDKDIYVLSGPRLDSNRGEELMLQRLSLAKDGIKNRAAHSIGHSARSSSLQESSAWPVKNFGTLFSSDRLFPRSYEDITKFVKKMCDQFYSSSSRATRSLWEEFGARNAHPARQALKTPFYKRFCSDTPLEGAWISKNGFNWQFSKSGTMSAAELKDYGLGEWIYKVRLIQLIRFLRPHLIKIPHKTHLNDGMDWDVAIDIVSNQTRTLATSTYIHSVFLDLKLPRKPDTLKMYRGMLNSVSDASLVANGKHSEQKALEYLQTSIPEIIQMEKKKAHSYQKKAKEFWAGLS
ncbi:hypothetical protein BJ684DRAFT_14424, partial [Piptocephalis cylindrospora]